MLLRNSSSNMTREFVSNPPFQVSGCLGYIGGYTTQSCGDHNNPLELPNTQCMVYLPASILKLAPSTTEQKSLFKDNESCWWLLFQKSASKHWNKAWNTYSKILADTYAISTGDRRISEPSKGLFLMGMYLNHVWILCKINLWWAVGLGAGWFGLLKSPYERDSLLRGTPLNSKLPIDLALVDKPWCEKCMLYLPTFPL